MVESQLNSEWLKKLREDARQAETVEELREVLVELLDELIYDLGN